MRVARLARLALGLSLGLAGGLAGCGETSGPQGPSAPRTAGERARAEKAASSEEPVDAKGKRWGGWRYQGSRDECFFVVKRRCFTEREAACRAARCGAKRCVVEGGGPATVRCQ
ncbi:MAG: hypothetical protein HS111_37445 [Kofleriaceae bacterium]|nr:hypothetical protein [Kofleriaceae bacterium]MCL4227213.1 hypothetical protein [Myxococcales bacterium]